MTEDILNTIGPAIAKHLPGWRYCQTDRGYFLIPSGVPGSNYSPWRNHCQGMWLNIDNGRLIVSGVWPHGPADSGWRAIGPSDAREGDPRITVSAGRSPEKIAADILRRFLPEYQRIYATLQTCLDKNVNGERRQYEVAAEFAAIMGDRQQRPAHASWFGKDCYGYVGVNHGGETGKLEIRGDIKILKAALIAAGKAGAFRKDD